MGRYFHPASRTSAPCSGETTNDVARAHYCAKLAGLFKERAAANLRGALYEPGLTK